MNATRNHHAARRIVGCVGGLALLVTGCGSSSGAPTGEQYSSAQWVTVQALDAVPRYAAGSCAVPPGGSADLVFDLKNNRISAGDQLTGITTDAADRVVLHPAQLDLQPFGIVAVGLPDGDPPSTVTATVEGLHAQARPGGSLPLTFHFAQAGAVQYWAPIRDCANATNRG